MQEALADAGARHIRASMREGDFRGLITRMLLDPETAPVRKIARRFACLVAEAAGAGNAKVIDERNRHAPVAVCHSHDFCDANVCMREALLEVTGIDAFLEEVMDDEQQALAAKLCDYAWRYAKWTGFQRLSAVRGSPDSPPEQLTVAYQDHLRSLIVELPSAPPLEENPLEIDLDYWGRNPHLQVLCRNHTDEEGEPVVRVRYDASGKVVEVIVAPGIKVQDDYSTSAWEQERDANPPCPEGDQLRMPSGLVGEVHLLRSSYEDLEEFRAYAETYGLLERLHKYPGGGKHRPDYASVEEAWKANPLVVSTVNPADFSTVPRPGRPTVNEEAG